jgi:hypothetical protein
MSSVTSQKKNMLTIHNLVSQPLCYIFGEHETKANGAKKQFLIKSAVFLRALGNDLGFEEYRVKSNPSGIAVSGEITLMGMWGKGNGLYMQIFQSETKRREFLYRSIKHMLDYSGGLNHWIPYSIFQNGEYENLVYMLLDLKKPMEALRHVA